MENVVTNWFGDDFSRLHPLLQKLHKEGGELSGIVHVEYGTGLAKWMAQRLAAKLGIPLTAGNVNFKVKIEHSEDSLIWSRFFADDLPMISIFKPQGTYKNGYWIETTGKLSLELGVKIIDGGWYWVQRKISFCGFPLPSCLFPRTDAYKKIVDEQYLFSVTFSLPIIGKLLSYSGKLDAQKNTNNT